MKPYYSLSDFPDRKNAGKNFIARCPKCGTMHLYISKAKGLYHCFYAGCEFNGILTDYCKDKRPMFSYPKEKSSDRTGTYLPPGTRHLTGNLPEYRNATENSVNEVPMLPGDYKILSPAVLQKIKPLDESPECTDPDQLAARRYLADQGISLATAIATHIGCLRHYCITKNSEDKREQASSVFPCIAYVNYVDGRPVNAKYRSCSPSPSAKTVTAANASAVSGEIEIPDGTTEESSVTYSKFWSQDSPTKPCAPYNIDCINPLLVEEETIPRLIIVEGEKDVLVLMEAGYRHVISVPSGAASDLAKSFEAFTSWLDQVQDIVICGDTDLPGRTLVKHLSDYFGARCLFTTLPGGCKDIGDVMNLYGTEVVQSVIEDACACHTTDIITVEQRQGRGDERAARQIRPRLQRGLRPLDRPRFPSHRHRRSDHHDRYAQQRKNGFSERPDQPHHARHGTLCMLPLFRSSGQGQAYSTPDTPAAGQSQHHRLYRRAADTLY